MNVARDREPGEHLKQIVADFGISESCLTNCESCLTNWMKAADVEDDVKPGTTVAENADLRAARRRIRLLGERGPAPGCGLPVPGQPAGKGATRRP